MKRVAGSVRLVPREWIQLDNDETISWSLAVKIARDWAKRDDGECAAAHTFARWIMEIESRRLAALRALRPARGRTAKPEPSYFCPRCSNGNMKPSRSKSYSRKCSRCGYVDARGRTTDKRKAKK